jgi:hypothetical protein
MAIALLVIGALFELGGIVALGFPDLLPGAVRLSAWLRRFGRRVINRLRRLVRRKPLPVVVSAGVGGAIAGGISPTGAARTSETTLEGKVDYLLRRDQDAQRQASQFDTRLARLETESPRRLVELRRTMEEHVARELSAALEAYRPLRVAGTVALAIGLACVTAATLLA